MGGADPSQFKNMTVGRRGKNPTVGDLNRFGTVIPDVVAPILHTFFDEENSAFPVSSLRVRRRGSAQVGAEPSHFVQVGKIIFCRLVFKGSAPRFGSAWRRSFTVFPKK